MRLLVLGGTQFLSRAVAAEAAQRGHDVVCASRGRSGVHPPGVTRLHWDREEDAPAELAGADGFAAVIDVARQPSHVRRALAVVPEAHWVYVSSISAYADHGDPAGPGVGRLHEPITEDTDLIEHPEAYGGLKVACEELVRAGAASAVVVRPGLIVGPEDPSGRFAYWASRADVTGDVLGPGDPGARVQVVDVRDVAAWLVTLAEERTTGTLDVVGPAHSMADFLAACLPTASPVWVDQAFLLEQDVEPWAGPASIPVWLPRPAYDGMMGHDPQPALDAGLVVRPLAETCRDTATWLASDPSARITGITREREAELLAAYRSVDS